MYIHNGREVTVHPHNTHPKSTDIPSTIAMATMQSWPYHTGQFLAGLYQRKRGCPRATARRYTIKEELRRAVEDAFRTITPQMFRRMSRRTWRRIRLPVQHHGPRADPLAIYYISDSKNYERLRLHSAWCTVTSRPQGRPVEIQAQTHWNLIRRNTTAPQPALPTSRILPPYSSHCACIPARKNSACVSKFVSFLFVFKF